MMNKQTIFLLLTITSLTACGSGVYLSVRGDHASNVIVFMDDKKEGTISLVTSTNSGFFGDSPSQSLTPDLLGGYGFGKPICAQVLNNQTRRKSTIQRIAH